MPRQLLILCSAASLMLCLSTSVLWLRSYSRADSFLFVREHAQPSAQTPSGSQTASGSIYLSSNRGVLCLGGEFVDDNWSDAAPQYGLVWRSSSAYQTQWGDSFLESLPVGFDSIIDPPGSMMAEVYLPHWGVIVVALPMTFFVWRTALRVRQGSRLDPGACGDCGYDLGATPDR